MTGHTPARRHRQVGTRALCGADENRRVDVLLTVTPSLVTCRRCINQTTTDLEEARA